MRIDGRFAVYSPFAGDYFFSEIRHLLASALRGCGASAREADERDGFLAEADWHVVVAPQEFFYLGRGRRLRTAPWPPGVVLFNAEQPGSASFELLRRLLPRAHAVWDLDPAAAALWSGEGVRASCLPLGFVDGCAYFEPAPEPFERRALDVLFAGSRVPRRDRFFKRAAPRLSAWKNEIVLVDDDRYLRPADPAARTRRLLASARRAKIVLNIHREDRPYFEWHRIALHGIGQGALVVSEPTTRATPFKAGRDFVETTLERMPEALDYFLGSPAGRREAARIAARGLRTYRERGRLADLLPAAVAGLGPARLAAEGRSRLRLEAAVSLLR